MSVQQLYRLYFGARYEIIDYKFYGSFRPVFLSKHLAFTYSMELRYALFVRIPRYLLETRYRPRVCFIYAH